MTMTFITWNPEELGRKTQVPVLSLLLICCVILGKSDDFSGFICFLLGEGVPHVSPGAP